MTQWLIEEAAFAALDAAERFTAERRVAADEQHARLTQMALRQLGG